MLSKLCLPVILLLAVSANSQFKNDNVLYKTVDPADLCTELEKNKGYILLDVRSKGEHDDTSQSPSYNLGHLKGAINIDIRELGKRLSEIQGYKDKPVFVYCSHSQRSRRAGKMLADSGFTNIYNINGGMTAIHYRESTDDYDCAASLVETKNKYDIISANGLCALMRMHSMPFILDVRSDSAFKHISRDAKENAFGTIRRAVNIPLSELPGKLSFVPKYSRIVITDMYGDEAAKAAVLLTQNDYPSVYVLIEGIDRILYTDSRDMDSRCKNWYISPVAYKMFNATEFGRYAAENNNYILVDIRSKDEFENKHKDSWRNIGHIKNAVHIPADVINSRLSELDKNKEVVIYGFGTGTEVYATADLLQKSGFSKVRLLVGGIFNLRWSAGNVKGQSHLKDMVVDVPEMNR